MPHSVFARKKISVKWPIMQSAKHKTLNTHLLLKSNTHLEDGDQKTGM